MEYRGRWTWREGSDVDGLPTLYVGLPDRRVEMNDFSLRYAQEDVAEVFNGNLDNARLIAAAPALLESLQLVLTVADGAQMLLTGEAIGPVGKGYGELDMQILNDAREVIAKVLGR